ncbi:selenium metabolism-associated LysR family transcriptional regulator [Bacilliculturomica massiliensis]|uniref:selenium metabolism-associated LysR family transcriptional regulator n=1 Tax=Bacilliculturomica massiliensis TaxID=1917867 RepID=UPI0010312331|nr:selenium metabolism-associated LysR family transcriptional regulator [Bacilliculturomica massiliensis]
MEFKQIEAFVNVVKYKSFSKAADACFLTQPTISAHISTLEKELGVPLLDRNGRGAVPTGQGKVFYKYAAAMLNTREKASMAIQGYGKDMRGVLEIQSSAVPGEYMLPGLLAEFHELYPAVRYYVMQSDSEEVSRNIMAGKGELGFAGSVEDSALTYEALLEDELVVIAPADGRLGQMGGDEIAAEDFMDEPMILREQGSGTRREFENYISGLGIRQRNMNVVARLSSLEAIKQAVKGGMGSAVISRLAAEDLAGSPDVRIFRIRGLQMNRMFYLVHNKSITLSPIAETFRGFVTGKYQELRRDALKQAAK